MNSFEQEWPANGELNRAHEAVTAGIDVIRNQLILPGDQRWEIAYGSLVMSGADSSVLAEGEPGTGKTQFGNIVMGEKNRVNIANNDTTETLEGYKRPTDGEWNEGRFPLDDPEDLILYLNEISHLSDTGPLHKYWDGEEVVVNGVRYNLLDAAIYATTNFADGRRAKKLDSALRSRFGVSVLAGDMAADIAPKLLGNDLGKRSQKSNHEGILPPAKTRAAIREGLMRRYPLENGAAGEYMYKVIEKLNASGLLLKIVPTDSRISNGWQQAERARRLVNGGSKEAAIKPEDLACVAALALGSAAMLSSTGAVKFENGLGALDALSPLERAVIARRIVAGIAFKTTLEVADFGQLKEEQMSTFMDKRSYANSPNSDDINGIVIESVVGGKDRNPSNTQETQDGSTKRRNIFRRLTR